MTFHDYKYLINLVWNQSTVYFHKIIPFVSNLQQYSQELEKLTWYWTKKTLI